jgi:hypothetical protein
MIRRTWGGAGSIRHGGAPTAMLGTSWRVSRTAAETEGPP